MGSRLSALAGRPLDVLFRRQLDEDELAALIDNACTQIARRTAHGAVGASLAAEIVDRRLATHAAIASVLADIRTAPDRSTLLEPLRGALRRESASLLSTRPGHVESETSRGLLAEVDDVLSPDSVDCLMVAAGHDIAVARNVLGEALATVLARAGGSTGSGSFEPLRH